MFSVPTSAILVLISSSSCSSTKNLTCIGCLRFLLSGIFLSLMIKNEIEPLHKALSDLAKLRHRSLVHNEPKFHGNIYSHRQEHIYFFLITCSLVNT